MNAESVNDRVIVLLDSTVQRLEGCSVPEALEAVASGDAVRVGRLRGSFALVAVAGRQVRMARTLDRPLRFFLAKRVDGPILIVSDRIDTLKAELERRGLAEQFHPSYTRMVPAHHVMDLELRGCPDPSPRLERFFTPPRETLPVDRDVAGRTYVEALRSEIELFLRALDPRQPVGVAFSGGIDSGVVLLLAHDVLTTHRLNPARLKAFTLAVDGGGADLTQARSFLAAVGLGLYLEAIEVASDRLDPRRAVATIEDYKPLDVECATANLALLEGVRARYPEWSVMLDGDGGDENLKDYPLEEGAELTIRSVLSNPLLYQEGWGVGAVKHSQVYSGGQSRGTVRSYAPARRLGFTAFSPHSTREVIAAAEAIPFVALTDWSVQALYDLKGDLLARGLRQVTGMELPVFPKRRFQHGAMDQGSFQRVFPRGEAAYRRMFDALHP